MDSSDSSPTVNKKPKKLQETFALKRKPFRFLFSHYTAGLQFKLKKIHIKTVFSVLYIKDEQNK